VTGSDIAEERRARDELVGEHARLLAGREPALARLTKLVTGADAAPVVVTGPPGIGKTALLARWVADAAAGLRELRVLSCFAGASPASSDRRGAARLLCRELQAACGLADDIPDDDGKLPAALASLLVSATRRAPPGGAREAAGRIVVVVDGLDLLDPAGAPPADAGWLLDAVPVKARLVASCREGPLLDSLLRRGARQVALPPLSADERRELLGKLGAGEETPLDDPETAALLSREETGNPLYLRAALSLLRLSGDATAAGRMDIIGALPAEAEALFDLLLEKLEAAAGRELVEVSLALLDASRRGLAQEELLALLAEGGLEPEQVGQWGRLAGAAGPCLLETRGGLLRLRGAPLAGAVRRRYFGCPDVRPLIADHFGRWPADARRLDEQPWQLFARRDRPALARTLADLHLLRAARDTGRLQEWARYWASLEGSADPAALYDEALAARGRAGTGPRELAALFAAAGRLLLRMSLDEAAERLLRRALALREEASGRYALDVAEAAADLAGACLRLGKPEEAQGLLVRALTIVEASRGTEHAPVVRLLGELARVRAARGERAQAEQLLRRALAVVETTSGPGHPDAAGLLVELAALARTAGRADESEQLAFQALSVLEEHFGPDHPGVAAPLRTLAAVLRAGGRHAESEALYRRALSVLERALGPEHPDVTVCLGDLANLFVVQGRYDDAEALFRQSLRIHATNLGEEHLAVAALRENLAIFLRSRGKLGDAEEQTRRCLEVRERLLGELHRDVATAAGELASIIAQQGRASEAEPFSFKSLSINLKVLGEGHPDVATSLNNLAFLYASQGRHGDALPFYRRAVAIAEKALGPEHPATLAFKENLGACEGMLRTDRPMKDMG